ncbi:hypothetical protein TrLO_g5062 [Triparma laevis f. longispina]|uniref:WW domain-containing protein n=1 Tax=Triparma laevis f. longispina TaxID=1714387 RepID=A0A9W6Z9G9_9STRA|nr:hypothetical protein TrLO_g5062 [Triparma laevis f. longispina]
MMTLQDTNTGTMNPRAKPFLGKPNNKWDEHVDEASGELYWHNRVSGATSWEVPNAVDDWDQHLDEASGSPYWHNRVTRVTSWEDPSAMGGHEWVQHIDEESGVQYWHHPLIGDITWDDPAQLPGHVSNKTVCVRRKSLIVVLGEDRDEKVIELMSTTKTTFVN